MGPDSDTISAYNAYCHTSEGKKFSIGGIHTDTKMVVLDRADEVISALYAVGTDSSECCQKIYTTRLLVFRLHAMPTTAIPAGLP